MNPNETEIKLLSSEQPNREITRVNTALGAPNDLQPKPTYLNLMRIVAGIFLILGMVSAVIGGILLLGFILVAPNTKLDKVFWAAVVIGSILQCFVVYGVLNALADIAENMVDVGNYTRQLMHEKKKEKFQTNQA